MRAFEDDEDTDWWFASTACPLIAAATTPLANMLSIAALVTSWRVSLDDGHGGLLPDFAGTPYADPRW
jgi:potassium channel subfamily K